MKVNEKEQGQQKRRRGTKEKNDYKRAYIGFEYECHTGHRFCPENSLLGTSLPLFLKSPSSNAIGQLQRIYIVTPRDIDNTFYSIILNPIIQFTRKSNALVRSPDPQSESYQFKIPHEIVLPWDSFICFRLPFIYINPEDSKPFGTDSTNFIASLMDNVVYCVKSNSLQDKTTYT